MPFTKGNKTMKKIFVYLSAILLLSSCSSGNGDLTPIPSDSSVWEKIFFDNYENSEGTSVHQTLDGGYIITGIRDNSAFLLKTNNNGSEEWSNSFDLGDIARGVSVQQTEDGGFLIFCNGANSNNHPINPGSFSYLIKTNENGIEEWNKPYYGMGLIDGKLTTDDGYVVIENSSIQSIFTANGDVYESKFHLYKFNENGTIQWAKGFDQYHVIDQVSSVNQTSDGGFIIAGRRDNSALLLKTNNNGNEEWYNTYANNLGGAFTFAQSVSQTADGGYIMIVLKEDYSESYILKTDNSGNEEWSRNFSGNSNNSLVGYSINQTLDGGYIITGDKRNVSNYSTLCLLKINQYGDSLWSKQFVDTILEIKYNSFGRAVQQTTDVDI